MYVNNDFCAYHILVNSDRNSTEKIRNLQCLAKTAKEEIKKATINSS